MASATPLHLTAAALLLGAPACNMDKLDMASDLAAPDPFYAEAVQEYRAGRWSSAFGRFITLANNGDVDAARIALFMELHGRQLYSSDWDASEEDIALWSRMTGTRAPGQVERVASSPAGRPPPWRARMTRFITRTSAPMAVAGGCHAGKCQ